MRRVQSPQTVDTYTDAARLTLSYTTLLDAITKADATARNERTRGLSLVKEVIKYYATGRGALNDLCVKNR